MFLYKMRVGCLVYCKGSLPDTTLPIYPGLGLAFRNALACAYPVAVGQPRVQCPAQGAAAPVSVTIQVPIESFSYTLD